MRPILRLACTFVAVTPSIAVGQPCETDWQPFEPGLRGSTIDDLVVFDDGSGLKLFAVGYLEGGSGFGFHTSLAYFDGNSWTGIYGAPFVPYELNIYDDGSGPALYIAGHFSNSETDPARRGIAKWNGIEIESLGAGITSNGIATSMAEFDGDLFVGGDFSSVDDLTTKGLARWNGSEWADASSGLEFVPWDLLVHDDGTGPALYAAGAVGPHMGDLVGHVARWDGEQWIDLNLNANSAVVEMASFDDGTGPALYAGGWFTEVDGVSTGHILRWNGTAWEPLVADLNGLVKRVRVLEPAGVPTLFVTGAFSFNPDQDEEYVATWDGSEWNPVPNSGPGVPRALVLYDRGDGPQLTAGGLFQIWGGDGPTDYLATLGCIPEDCPGDVNGDNRTDLVDLNLVLANFGAANEKGDLTGDGNVDIADLNLLLSNFGVDCG